jgi:hypothetical protein
VSYLQSYRLIYDARLEEQIPFWPALLGLVFFGGIGLAVLIGTFVVRDKAGMGGLRLFGAMMLAVSLWGGYRNWGTMREDAEASRGLDSGGYALVEGVVTRYWPGNRKGRHEEWIVESEGVTYRYALRTRVVEREDGAALGPVREGSRVRISDVDGRIARLELVTGDPGRLPFPMPR